MTVASPQPVNARESSNERETRGRRVLSSSAAACGAPRGRALRWADRAGELLRVAAAQPLPAVGLRIRPGGPDAERGSRKLAERNERLQLSVDALQHSRSK